MYRIRRPRHRRPFHASAGMATTKAGGKTGDIGGAIRRAEQPAYVRNPSQALFRRTAPRPGSFCNFAVSFFNSRPTRCLAR